MTYQNYEFTAFSEADLLSGGDKNLGCGDTFTMPGSASVCISVSDNDRSLSGDNYRNENADDRSGQQASISGDGGELGNGGQIYAESYYWVSDQHGNWYVMIEIEQEGTNADYFTFHNAYGVPPAGAELTVSSGRNVCGSWVDYKCLDAGEKEEFGSISGTVFCDVDCDGINGGEEIVPGCDYTIEAEHMREWGFKTVHGDNASGGKLVRLDKMGGDGALSTKFDGKDGVYDVKIHVQDECDGQSKIKLLVNGQLVEAIRLDGDGDGWGSNNGQFSTYVIQDVALETNDQIKLAVWGNRGEFVRIDKIELEGQDSVVRTQEPPKEGVLIKLVDAQTGEVIATTVSDGNGEYEFAEVPVGDYKIMGVAPDGTEFTIQDAGDDDSIDSDVDSNGMSGTVSVTANSETDIDLGLKEPEVPEFRICDDPDAVNIGFEGFAAGTVIDDEYAGVTISAQRDDNNTPDNDAMVFDSANPTGDDEDLATDSQGNLLIVSEDNDSSDPDDAVGGTITFDFERPAFLYDIKVVDTEEGGTITLTLEGGGTVEFDIPNIGDGDIAQVLLDTDGVVSMTVDLDGSGAIDDLCYVPGEPQPGSLSGRYFCDEDRDGLDNDGVGTGVAGVAVVLLDAAGDPVLDGGGNPVSTVTDDDGLYSFAGLDAGTYGVKFTDDVSGKVLTTQNVDGDVSDDIDSDAADIGGGMSQILNIVVNEGADTPDNDAGVVDELGSLSGRYFCDDDRDGLDNDGADNGVAGVTVALLDANGNAVLDAGGDPVTTTTAADGSYSFAGLVAATYGVKFTDDVSGKVLTTQNVDGDVSDDIDSDAADIGGNMSEITGIVVTPGADTPDNDAGVVEELGSLSGRYFSDADRDGLDNDGADNGVEGVTVTLLDAAGNPVLDGGGNPVTTTTDGDGNYSFGGLIPDTYGVKFTDDVSGKVLTTQNVDGDVSDDIDSDAADIGGGMSQILNIVVNEGADTPDNDAGVVDELGSLSGRYFCDDDRDGLDNDGADNGVAGVTVALLDANGNAVLDAGGDPVTTTTAADGSYSFAGLVAATYGVKFTDDVSGKVLTTQNVDGDVSDDIDSDAADIGGNMSEITGIVVTPGADTPDNDAGVVEELGSLSGRYFCDENRDDQDNDGAGNGIAGATVYLRDADLNDLGSTTTDANGNYRFDDLVPGDYRVIFESPATIAGSEDKEFVNPNVGDDATDSDVIIVGGAGNGMTNVVTVVADEETMDVDAGIFEPLGSLSGRYFCDDDEDGLDNDGADNGVVGVTVTLLDAGGNAVLDGGGNPVTTTTDANGNYSFAGLVAATYGVKFTDDVSGKVLTTQNVDNNVSDDIDSDAADLGGNMSQITGIVVTPGNESADNDAGVVEPNQDPTAADGEGEGCVDDGPIEVAAVFSDPDGDPVSITMIDGMAIADGETLTIDGVDVTLNGDTFQFDGASEFLGLGVGESAVRSFEFKVEDDSGAFATASIDVTFKGAYETAAELEASFPVGEVCFQIVAENIPLGSSDDMYTVLVTGADGDVRLDGVTFTEAYCVGAYEDILAASPATGLDNAPKLTGTISLIDDNTEWGSDDPASQTLAEVDPEITTDELDNMINYILNTDYAAQGYTDAEVQGAIWGITDNIVFVAANNPNSSTAGAQEILDDAIANGQSFEVGAGDVIGVFIDPSAEAEATGHNQPFMVGITWDECIC